MRPDERLAAAAKEAAENEGDDDDIVELAGDRNEVGYQVERKREIPGQRNEQQLLASWHTGVAEEAAAEDDAIGDEAGERPSAFASAGDHERKHEQGIDAEKDSDPDQRPRPEAHASDRSDGDLENATP